MGTLIKFKTSNLSYKIIKNRVHFHLIFRLFFLLYSSPILFLEARKMRKSKMTEKQTQYLIGSYNQVFKTGFKDFPSIDSQVTEDLNKGKKGKAYTSWFESLLKFDYEGFYTYVWNHFDDSNKHRSIYKYIEKSGQEIQQLLSDYGDNFDFMINKDSYFGSYNQTSPIETAKVSICSHYIWNEEEDDVDDEMEQDIYQTDKFNELTIQDSFGLDYKSFYFSLFPIDEKEKEKRTEIGRISFNHLDYMSNDNIDNNCYELTFGYSKPFLDDESFFEAAKTLINKAFDGGILRYELGKEEKGEPRNKYLIRKVPFSMISYQCFKDDDSFNKLALELGFIHDCDESVMNQKHQMIKISHYYLINPEFHRDV